MRETSHGKHRREASNRPSPLAQQDRLHPREMYIDTETGYLIYVGSNGRTHVFTDDDAYHTSFTTTRRNRILRVIEGKWVRKFEDS